MIATISHLPTPETTLELLWQRMRERGNLPGFSKVIGALSGLGPRRDDPYLGVTKTVLSDPALTQRVLRLANSAMYSVFAQGINTVSKAVLVLGTESIVHLALGMKLIDDLSMLPGGSSCAREEMQKAVLAGHIARQVASTSVRKDDEEAVVCSILHNLGKMMVTFYLPDRWEEVQQRKAQGTADEQSAASDVLGMRLDDISREVAQRWNLPQGIVDTLQDAKPGKESSHGGRTAWLRSVSTMSSRCAEVAQHDPMDSAALMRIAEDFAATLGLEPVAICTAVGQATILAAEDAAKLNAAPSEAQTGGANTATDRRKHNAADILFQGVADMASVGREVGTGQLLTIALETVYQGLCASNAIAFLRNREQKHYAARVLLGTDPHGHLARLQFSDQFQPDVFHAALASDKVVFVENAKHPIFASKLPQWWCNAFRNVKCFVILPIVVNRQPVGFIYGDWQESHAAHRLNDVEIATLNEIRGLIVNAMAQRL